MICSYPDHVKATEQPKTLDNRELATALAALRFWQLRKRHGGVPVTGIADIDRLIASDGDVTPLSVDEIDTLIDRLNAPTPTTSRLSRRFYPETKHGTTWTPPLEQ